MRGPLIHIVPLSKNKFKDCCLGTAISILLAGTLRCTILRVTKMRKNQVRVSVCVHRDYLSVSPFKLSKRVYNWGYTQNNEWSHIFHIRREL